MKLIPVLTNGGDGLGMNAAVWVVVRTALKKRWGVAAFSGMGELGS